MKPDKHVDESGTERWLLGGKMHREDGPAVVYFTGTKVWYLNGKIHREGGPAIIFADGDEHWYLNGEEVDPMKVLIQEVEELEKQLPA
jgi:hypothetical protein